MVKPIVRPEIRYRQLAVGGVYFALIGGLLQMADLMSFLPCVWIGELLILAECFVDIPAKIRTGVHFGMLALIIGVLLLWREQIYNGGMLYANRVFEKSEELGAYEYDYFSLSMGQGEEEKALFSFLILSSIVLAVILAQLLCGEIKKYTGFFVLIPIVASAVIEIYLGVFFSSMFQFLLVVSTFLYLSAVTMSRRKQEFSNVTVYEEGQKFNSDKRNSEKRGVSALFGILAVTVIFSGILSAVLSVAVTEKNPVLYQYSEKIRDSFGERVQNRAASLSGETQAGGETGDFDGYGERDENDGATGNLDNQSGLKGSIDSFTEVMSKNVASILSEPIPWLRILAIGLTGALFLWLIFRMIRRYLIVRKRKKIFAESEGNERCRYLFRYLMSWMFFSGLQRENKPYSFYLEKIKLLFGSTGKQYPRALELWQRAAYSDRPVEPEELAWLYSYVETVRQQLWSGLSWKEKWTVYMRECL